MTKPKLTEEQIEKLEYCFSHYPKEYIKTTGEQKYTSLEGVENQLHKLYELDDKVGFIFYVSSMIPMNDGNFDVKIEKFLIQK